VRPRYSRKYRLIGLQADSTEGELLEVDRPGGVEREVVSPEAFAIFAMDDRTALPDLALRSTSIRAAATCALVT
jgi:hypothetical protein